MSTDMMITIAALVVFSICIFFLFKTIFKHMRHQPSRTSLSSGRSSSSDSGPVFVDSSWSGDSSSSDCGSGGDCGGGGGD